MNTIEKKTALERYNDLTTDQRALVDKTLEMWKDWNKELAMSHINTVMEQNMLWEKRALWNIVEAKRREWAQTEWDRSEPATSSATERGAA